MNEGRPGGRSRSIPRVAQANSSQPMTRATRPCRDRPWRVIRVCPSLAIASVQRPSQVRLVRRVMQTRSTRCAHRRRFHAMTPFLACSRQLPNGSGASKGVDVKLVVTFDTHIEDAILVRARHAKQDVTFLRLTLVQCCALWLADRARNYPGRTCDTAAIPAGDRQDMARRLDHIDDRLVFADYKRHPASIAKCHCVPAHFTFSRIRPGPVGPGKIRNIYQIQISDEQSPPG